MSVNIPPSLNWVFEMAAGQSWPQGDEDKMRQLRDVWYDAQSKFNGISQEIGPAAEGVVSSFTGSVADQFASFVNQLQQNVPAIAETAGQLGQLSDQVALNIETSKYMILAQLAWMAEQIIEWSATIWGLAVVPEIEALGRLMINRIVQQLVRSVVESVLASLAIDSAVQGIEMLKGDRTKWDTSETLKAVEIGAMAGAISGITHIGAGAISKSFVDSLLGHVGLGALDGTLTAYSANGLLGTDLSPWMAASAGAVGGGFAKIISSHPGGDDPIDVPNLDEKSFGVTFPPVRAPETDGLDGGDGPPAGHGEDDETTEPGPGPDSSATHEPDDTGESANPVPDVATSAAPPEAPSRSTETEPEPGSGPQAEPEPETETGSPTAASDASTLAPADPAPVTSAAGDPTTDTTVAAPSGTGTGTGTGAARPPATGTSIDDLLKSITPQQHGANITQYATDRGMDPGEASDYGNQFANARASNDQQATSNLNHQLNQRLDDINLHQQLQNIFNTRTIRTPAASSPATGDHSPAGNHTPASDQGSASNHSPADNQDPAGNHSAPVGSAETSKPGSAPEPTTEAQPAPASAAGSGSHSGTPATSLGNWARTGGRGQSGASGTESTRSPAPQSRPTLIAERPPEHSPTIDWIREQLANAPLPPVHDESGTHDQTGAEGPPATEGSPGSHDGAQTGGDPETHGGSNTSSTSGTHEGSEGGVDSGTQGDPGGNGASGLTGSDHSGPANLTVSAPKASTSAPKTPDDTVTTADGPAPGAIHPSPGAIHPDSPVEGTSQPSSGLIHQPAPGPPETASAPAHPEPAPAHPGEAGTGKGKEPATAFAPHDNHEGVTAEGTTPNGSGHDAAAAAEDHTDALAHYAEPAAELTQAAAAHQQLLDRVQGAGSSHDAELVGASEARLVNAVERFDDAEDQLTEAGIGDLSGRDDPRLPETLSALPADQFHAVMNRAGDLLGRPGLVTGGPHDDEAAAVHEAQEEARAQVASALAAGDDARAKQLAEELSGPSGFRRGGLAGGAVEVNGRNLTTEFRNESARIPARVRQEIDAEIRPLQRRQDQIRAAIARVEDERRVAPHQEAQAHRDLEAGRGAALNGVAARRQQLSAQYHYAAQHAHSQSHLNRINADYDDARHQLSREERHINQDFTERVNTLNRQAAAQRRQLTNERNSLSDQHQQVRGEIERLNREEGPRILSSQRMLLRTYIQHFRDQVQSESFFTPAGARPFSHGEELHFQGLSRAVDQRLARLIVEPTGHRGYHSLLGRDVGRHPDFGAKVNNTRVNNATDLARGIVGWIDAKPNRHAEKLLARQIERDGHVENMINVLMTRANRFIDTLPNATAIRRELASDRNDRDGSPLGTYLPYFRTSPSVPHDLRPVGGRWNEGMIGPLRHPSDYSLREKVMVLHDLMEYFGSGRHTTPTHGANLLQERPEDFLSTAAVSSSGRRVAATPSRGQNPAFNPADGRVKEHPSTRDENDITTILARDSRIPVWAGQSFTAARMYRLAHTVGGSPHEIGAVAWGTFAFWRLHFDHTTPLAYHTLHETMETAQNFGVPYSFFDRDASLRQISVDRVVADARQLSSDLRHSRLRDANAMEIDDGRGRVTYINPDYTREAQERRGDSLRAAIDRLSAAPDSRQRREALIKLLDRYYQLQELYNRGTGLPG